MLYEEYRLLKEMNRKNLFLRQAIIFVITLLFSYCILILEGYASALDGPTCFAKVEVVNTGSEEKHLDSGRMIESHYADFKVLETINGSQCRILHGQIYRIINNYPGTLKKGDKIRSGVEFASSMGPDGVVNFIHWSPVTYVDGTAIKHSKNIVIDHFQSSQTPIKDALR